MSDSLSIDKQNILERGTFQGTIIQVKGSPMEHNVSIPVCLERI